MSRFQDYTIVLKILTFLVSSIYLFIKFRHFQENLFQNKHLINNFNNFILFKTINIASRYTTKT